MRQLLVAGGSKLVLDDAGQTAVRRHRLDDDAFQPGDDAVAVQVHGRHHGLQLGIRGNATQPRFQLVKGQLAIEVVIQLVEVAGQGACNAIRQTTDTGVGQLLFGDDPIAVHIHTLDERIDLLVCGDRGQGVAHLSVRQLLVTGGLELVLDDIAEQRVARQ